MAKQKWRDKTSKNLKHIGYSQVTWNNESQWSAYLSIQVVKTNKLDFALPDQSEETVASS